MEGSSDGLSNEEVEDRIPEVFANFRKAAHKQGMHDQQVEVSETHMAEAYRRGLADGTQSVH